MANTKLMGYEGKLYWGTKGSTAATELTIAKNVNYGISGNEADISDRESIIKGVQTGQVEVTLEFDTTNKTTDAFVAAVRAAAFAGDALAFRTRDKVAGWGIDADFVVSVAENHPLTEGQELKITCKPTPCGGRWPPTVS